MYLGLNRTNNKFSFHNVFYSDGLVFPSKCLILWCLVFLESNKPLSPYLFTGLLSPRWLLLISAPPDDGYIRPVTFWVVGDFDKPSGRQLLYDAIRHMVQNLFYSVSLFCIGLLCGNTHITARDGKYRLTELIDAMGNKHISSLEHHVCTCKYEARRYLLA